MVACRPAADARIRSLATAFFASLPARNRWGHAGGTKAAAASASGPSAPAHGLNAPPMATVRAVSATRFPGCARVPKPEARFLRQCVAPRLPSTDPRAAHAALESSPFLTRRTPLEQLRQPAHAEPRAMHCEHAAVLRAAPCRPAGRRQAGPWARAAGRTPCRKSTPRGLGGNRMERYRFGHTALSRTSAADAGWHRASECRSLPMDSTAIDRRTSQQVSIEDLLSLSIAMN
jgi:hypothetical protein